MRLGICDGGQNVMNSFAQHGPAVTKLETLIVGVDLGSAAQFPSAEDIAAEDGCLAIKQGLTRGGWFAIFKHARFARRMNPNDDRAIMLRPANAKSWDRFVLALSA